MILLEFSADVRIIHAKPLAPPVPEETPKAASKNISGYV
jgi:hypothetical protein